MPGYIVTFNGSQAATAVPELVVQSVDRPFMGDVRDEYVEVPGRESAWLFTEEAGDATLSMNCVLVGADGAARRASVRALAAWAASDDRALLVIGDEPDRQWRAKLASRPDVSEAVRLGRLTLDWRCQPYAEALTTTSQAITSTSLTFDVDGDANIPMYPVIEVTTTATSAAGVEITVNGVALGHEDSLASAVTRTYSALSATITAGANADAELANNGFVEGSTLTMQTADGDFGLLRPGSNTIAVTRGSATLRVVWRRRFA